MTSQELPSGGGAYERKADGTLSQVEAPTAPQPLAKALGTAFASLLNPINLIIPAVIAAAGYTIQWLTGAEDG